MKHKRLLCLVLSFALLLGAAMPGTLAVSADSTSSAEDPTEIILAPDVGEEGEPEPGGGNTVSDEDREDNDTDTGTDTDAGADTDTDTDDDLDVCPECGRMGDHAEDCPRADSGMDAQLPACVCGQSEITYFHTVNCPCYPANLTNAQALYVWEQLDDYDRESARYWFTEEQMEYIRNQTVTEPEEQTLTFISDLNSIAVNVTGRIPQGVELYVEEFDPAFMPAAYSLEEEPFADTSATLADLLGGRSCVGLDISLAKDGLEWQPAEGENVTVTLDAGDLWQLDLEEGDDFFVYHIHENEDGTTTAQWLGPFQVENGELSFEMPNFSYVILVNGTTQVQAKNFYYAFGASGNKHYTVYGMYVDQEENTHILLQGKSATSPKKVLDSVTIGSDTYYAPPATFTQTENVSKIELVDETTGTSSVVYSGSTTWFGDINLGQHVNLTESFQLSILFSAGGFNIEGADVILVFNDGIQKSVYSIGGTLWDGLTEEIPEVKAGDTVIYKIIVSNRMDSTQSVTGDVVDVLPEGIFDPDEVRFSIGDSGDWTAADPDAGLSFTLESGVTLEIGSTKTYYVQATVRPDADVGQYGNTSCFHNRESTAVVEVTVPPCGDLTIVKRVLKEYENDTLPEDIFTFTVDVNETDPAKEFRYEIKEADETLAETGTISDGGEIRLMNGQTATIMDVPVGAYTVTEEANENYRTYVGDPITASTIGESIYTAAGVIDAGESSDVLFTNIYTRHLADLTITKNGCQAMDANQSFLFHVSGTDIALDVVIHGNDSVTIRDLPVGTYTITENTDWSWRYTPDQNEYTVTLESSSVSDREVPEDAVVIVTNTREEENWLEGNTWCENQWSSDGSSIAPKKPSDKDTTGARRAAAVLLYRHEE